jgi:hypothetical protein
VIEGVHEQLENLLSVAVAVELEGYQMMKRGILMVS